MMRVILGIVIIASVVVGVDIFALTIWPDHRQKQRSRNADIEYLTTDAHVVVGDVKLVLPLVALRDYVSMGQFFSLDRKRARNEWKAKRESFRIRASDSGTAPTLGKLTVVIDAYGFDYSNGEELCSQLMQKWAKSVCFDPWAPLQQALPKNRFYYADDREIDAFDSHLTVGRERMSDHLRSMSLQAGKSSFVCDKEASSSTRFCTAATPITQHLMAVWTVQDGQDETVAQQATREGKAIVAFSRYILEPEGNFSKLVESACRLRRPGSDAGLGAKPYPCDG